VPTTKRLGAKDNEMNERSLKVLEEILEEVLGETSKEMIFIILEKKYDLKRNDVLKKPEVFRKALEDVLGAGGRVIETMVIQKITYRRVKL
jgi:GTPase SAR1 family protein